MIQLWESDWVRMASIHPMWKPLWLQQEGLKTKLSKCACFQPEFHYLGHAISYQGVSTGPSNVKVVANWQPPKTVSGIWSSLGFRSLLSLCIDWWHSLGAEHGVIGNWTEECHQSFKPLKTKLTIAPVLSFYRFLCAFYFRGGCK